MRKMMTIVVALMMGVMTFGQSKVPTLTAEAARYYQEKDYEEARVKIDQSITGDGIEDAYTWQVRGHIYKELYKTNERSIIDSETREIAIESFVRCLDLDTENQYLEWNRTSLRFLASTYWNDAVSLMEKKDRETLPEAERLYYRYEEVMNMVEPNEDLQKYTIDFYRAFATANRKIIEKLRHYESDIEEYQEEMKRVKESYNKALSIKADDYGSNYNLAINLYNEAAYRIGKIPAEADLTMIMLEQAGCIEIFKEALPIAKTAEELRPGRIEILKALRAIHLSLSNYDEFDRYNRLVKEKQGELIIDSVKERKLKRDYYQEQRVED